jgi:hypothetical protein
MTTAIPSHLRAAIRNTRMLAASVAIRPGALPEGDDRESGRAASMPLSPRLDALQCSCGGSVRPLWPRPGRPVVPNEPGPRPSWRRWALGQL